jgi:hypothetical protein
MSGATPVSTRSGNARSAAADRGLAALLWRGFWVAMFVLHAPACVVAFRTWGSDDFDWGRFAFLNGSQLLFLLKLLDVAWLRVPRDRRACTALIVAIVLLHGDVVQRLCATDAPDVTPSAFVLAGVGVLGFSSVLRAACDPRQARRARHAPRRVPQLLALWRERLDRVAQRPPRVALVRTGRVGRAPPR